MTAPFAEAGYCLSIVQKSTQALNWGPGKNNGRIKKYMLLATIFG
jgi:hypothetical protein